MCILSKIRICRFTAGIEQRLHIWGFVRGPILFQRNYSTTSIQLKKSGEVYY